MSVTENNSKPPMGYPSNMEFPKYNFPITWRRTDEYFPRLSDDYGCYGAVSYTKTSNSTGYNSEDSKTSGYEFNFKRLSGKQNKCNYIAMSTTLPLLHPDEDTGIPDVTIKDLFKYTVGYKKKTQPIRINRAAQQTAHFIKTNPEIVFGTSQSLLKGCFRTINRYRKNKVYTVKYQKTFAPVVVGILQRGKIHELLGDVLSDIQPDLIQTLLHEEIESMSKKIVNHPLYCGGCIAYEEVDETVGIILSACGPPMDVLKIQPTSIKKTCSSQSNQQSVPMDGDPTSLPKDTTFATSSATQTNTGPLLSPTKSAVSPEKTSNSDETATPMMSKHGEVNYTLDTEKEPHLIAFQGVIRQIVSSRASTQGIVYIGVRTDYHCHVLTTENDGGQLKFQILRTVEFQYQLTYIALSPFIPGECVITLENGEVDLITTNSGVVTLIPPMFEGFAGSVWRLCHFGSHPRLLVSTEHKKVDLIDVKDTVNLKETNLFQLPSKHLTQLEDILISRQHPSNYFLHFVATHHQLFMFDERLPQIPMLEWNHLLKTPPNYIDIFAPVNNNHVVVIASYGSCEAHCFQFELDGYKPPSVIGPGWKVANVRGWFSLLPTLPRTSRVYDAAKLRLEKPFIGTCIIGHKSNKNPGYTILMTNSLGDVFYQTFVSSSQRPELDKTLNVGPACPDIELSKPALKRCYDWVDALTHDDKKSPTKNESLINFKRIDVSTLYKEICADVEPDPGCPFCCEEPITGRYGHMTPSKCPACGLNPDVSFNLLEKYNSGPCVITRKSLGLSDEEDVDDIIGDDLHVKPGGQDTDEVGRTLWNLWKGSLTDNETSNDNAQKVVRRKISHSQGAIGQAMSLPDTIEGRPSQSQQDEISQELLSQQSVDLFSQPHSQSQGVRKSARKRKRPAKFGGVMGF